MSDSMRYVDSKDVVYFKSHYGPTTNWLSNFADCTVAVKSKDGNGKLYYPSVEHMYQAYTKVDESQRNMFQVGGIFADYDKFFDLCKQKHLEPLEKPKHGLIGWIANVVVEKKLFKQLGLKSLEPKPDGNNCYPSA
jgi:hypothetical protein